MGSGDDLIDATTGGLFIGFIDSAEGTIDGGSGVDTFLGSLSIGFRGDGTLLGGDGADVLNLFQGLAMGASLNLTGSRAEGVIDLGSGDDMLTTGNVSAIGFEGTATIDGGVGNDQMIFTGQTFLGFSSDPTSQSILGGEGDDVIAITGVGIIGFGDGHTTVAGGIGNDSLKVQSSALGGSSVGAGSLGEAVLAGDAGDDLIELDGVVIGGSGGSTIDGGSGADEILLTSNGFVQTLIQGFDPGAAIVRGGAQDDQITLNNVIVGLLGQGTVAGDEGMDTIVVTSGSVLGYAEVVMVGRGLGVVTGGADADVIHIENAAIVGLNGTGIVQGDAGDDVISVSAADVAAGDGGIGEIYGGDGLDTLNFVNADLGIRGSARVFGGANDDEMNFTATTALAAQASGTASLFGDGGNDSFLFNGARLAVAGQATLDGGAGDDTVSIFASSVADQIGSGMTFLGGDGLDVLNLIGNGFADRGQALVYGGADADTVNFSDAVDVGDHDTGSATFFGDDGDDLYAVDATGATFARSGTSSIYGGEGADTFDFDSGVSAVGVMTQALFDGGAGADTFDFLQFVFAVGGSATLNAGSGDDNVMFDTSQVALLAGSNALIDLGEGTDSFVTNSTFATAGQATFFAGAGNDSAIFNPNAHVAAAASASATLFGRAGEDDFMFDQARFASDGTATLYGGADDDSLTFQNRADVGSRANGSVYGDDGADSVTLDNVLVGFVATGLIDGGSGADNFILRSGVELGFDLGGQGILLGGSDNDSFDVSGGVIGHSGTGTIDGGDGVDTILIHDGAIIGRNDVGSGTIAGGLGNDSLIASSGVDLGFFGTGVFDGGEGDDTILFTLASNLGELGTGSGVVLGGGGNDSIFFTDNSDVAILGGGSIFAGSGDDRVNFSSGSDLANGATAFVVLGEGADVFTLQNGSAIGVQVGGVAGTVTGDSGIDTFNLLSSAVLGQGQNSSALLYGGEDGDIFNLSGMAVLGFSLNTQALLSGDAGDDSFNIGTAILGLDGAALLLGGDGAESFVFDGTDLGTQATGSATISGESGNDSFTVGVAFIGILGSGTLDGGADDDVMTFSGTEIGSIAAGAGRVLGGDGDDTVALLAATEVGANGAIDLGANDDRLRLEDSVLLSAMAVLDGGADTDTLELFGTGTGQLPAMVMPVNFENLEKTESGLWIWDQNATFSGTGDLQGGFFRVTMGTTLAFGGGLSVDSGAQLEGAGTISGAVANSGAIRVGDAADDISIFTINGNYTGGGSLFVDVNVAGDGLPADRLVINGMITGVTQVVVNDLLLGMGGVATATVGSLIIDGNDPGADAGAFTLGATQVISNMYEYFLVRDGDDWYLRNDVLGAGGGADLAMAGSLALETWYSAIRNLYLRMGELRGALLADDGGGQSASLGAADFEQLAASQPGHFSGGLWSRINGEKIQYEGTSLDGFRNTAIVAQVGYDQLSYDLREDGDRLLVGGMAGMISGQNDVTNSDTTQDYRGFSLGGYATYLTGGLHLDALVKVDRLEIDHFMPLVGFEGSQTAWVYGLSVEGGWRENFASGLFLEGDLRLSYAHASIEDLPDVLMSSATYDDGDSLRARAGATAGFNLDFNGATVTPFASLAVEHEFLGETGLTIDTTPFESDLEGTNVEIGGGLTALDRSGAFGLYMSGHYITGETKEGVELSLGMRVFW